MLCPMRNKRFYPHSVWCVFFFLVAVFPVFVQAQPPLRVVSSYQSPPGTLNVILENQGTTPVNIGLHGLGSPEEELAVPFWWSMVVNNPLAPNARTRMIISLTRPVTDAKAMNIKLMANQDEVSLDFAAHSGKNFLRYAVQDASTQSVYLYLANDTEIHQSITGMRLNGSPLKGGNSGEVMELAPGLGGIFYGVCPNLELSDGAYLAFIAEYKLGGESNTEAGYLFSSSQYVLGMEDRQNFVLDCPTHNKGPWKEVGANILAASLASTQPIPTVHFCRDRLAQGLPAFAQATPRIKINPQASNISRGKLDALLGYDEVLEMARRSVEPGMAISIMENTSIFSGAFGALRNPEDEPLSERELLLVSLDALAHGAKGLEFRVEESDGEAFAQRVQYLLIRFELLRSFLSIGEILPLQLKCSSDKVNVYSMVCGDKGLLLFILQKDYSEKTPLPDFSVTFAVPPFLALETFAEVSKGKGRGALKKEEGNTYALDVTNFDTAALYFCKSTQ